MKKVVNVLWGIAGLTNAIGFACMGIAIGLFFGEAALSQLREG